MPASDTGDVWEDRLDEENFNAGVLSFDPDQRIYDDLMAEHLNSTSYVWHGWAEQGLLNWCDPNQPCP